ncbi:MAG: hypothetical protein H7289_10720 [Mucilaginibacter sp.]|nr:hypothetical protein [Mucilaginibacter sp.]
MRTVTLDILDNKAVDLLKDLEVLKIIRIQDDKGVTEQPIMDLAKKYSGSMTKQSIEEIDKQLRDLRNGPFQLN